MDDAFAQEGDAGPATHLTLDQFHVSHADLVDAGVAAEGQSGAEDIDIEAGPCQLTGEDGLQQLTKRLLLQSALEGEITDHLGYDRNDPAGRNGGNSRNGTRAVTSLREPPVSSSTSRRSGS